MLSGISNWLDERTGYKALMSHALDEEIAGGARFAYVFGSALLVLFICQVITGFMLMATYTPGINSAWSSVFYLQHKVSNGWFIRGMHSYGAQSMVVVLGMHLLQVATYGAYKKPREVTWWFGLGLLGVLQGLALTGYLLPWDQKGYWATKVATNIAGTLPVLGPTVQTLIVGGTEYGQATLTRFYVLHVGVLPATLALLAVAHLALFRRHGATPPHGADLSKKEPFYPGQLARDVIFAVVVLFVIGWLTASTHGAHLDAPADPTADYPPRPEWYFLFLFQLLKYLPGSLELLGTVVLPGLAGAALFVLPFLDRGESNSVRARLPYLAPIFLGAVAVVLLTLQSKREDAADATFQHAQHSAHLRAERAIALAQKGIPPGGPLEMLASDPMTRGADVYAQNCAKCHVLRGEGEYDAPVHTGFGSRAWITGMIHEPQNARYFGRTHIDDMKSMDKIGPDNVKAVVEFLFAEGREPQDPPVDEALAKRGQEVFHDKCMDCHVYKGEGAEEFDGPNLTGYASRTWIAQQVAKPEQAYPAELNEMTAFAGDLSEHDIQMVAAFLRQQRFQEPESGALPNLKPKRAKAKAKPAE
ncbi:MAG TPA: cytochrome b N-terminal domain-containing protein [Polyangiales bacterium]|jgi:ubiquinol-cytochrome c reductase cytochrome b subunit|nr:cytochrome b N-terminal domain-containing protein [Polyangiales bacterium]